MRSAEDLARWARGGLPQVWRRRLGAVEIAVLVVVASGWAVWAAAGVYVEWLWFDGLGYGEVFTRRALGQTVAFAAGAALFFLLYAGSLRLAGRFGGLSDESGSAEEGLWTYLARVSAGLSQGQPAAAVRRADRLLLAVGALLALFFGLAAANTWERWLLALFGGGFGLAEPLFGQDVGFYVFILPLLRTVHAWLLAALLAIALATLAALLARARYELNYSPRRALLGLSRPARLHLAALGAAFFVLMALHHQLSLLELVFATTGQAFRLAFPGYTEAHARVPALWGMTLVALAASGLVFWTARSQPSRRLLLGPALWLLVLVVGTVYPAAVQAVIVKPNEAVLERPYLAQVIQMARAAYGLNMLIEHSISAERGSPSLDMVQSDLRTLSNLRLWEPEPLRLALNQLQAARPYYGFFLYPDLDRYLVNGQARTLMVAARELDPQALPARSWFNTRLQFTHGYGVVAASASLVGPDGRPVFPERDVPSRGELGLVRPEIYFGERTTEPALVRPADLGFDSPRDETTSAPYQGSAGVPLGGPLGRLAHAIRLSDINLALSPAIGSDTALLHRRQVAERVQQLAPFLLLDADPYPVVADGRVVWLLDGYTASDRFPFAPRAPARLLAADPRPGQTRSMEPNYLRGAVKATVDAYDGKVGLYLADVSDPIAATYARLYPGLLQPFESMPAALRTHVRYPQQLFMVQADALARFHVADPGQLYSGEDAWLVARGRLETRPDARPLYGLQRLPGDEAEEFALTIPFRPYSQANDRHNLVALLAARSDPAGYGELLLYRYPRDRPVEGPFQAELRIDQDPLVSSQFGLWQRSGAQVVRGEVQTIPLGNNVLYLQSIYLQRAERSALPELQRVVAVASGRVVMEPSLQAALSGLFGVAIDLPDAGAATVASPDRPASSRELALSAQEHLQRAQEALFAGDRARHERELQAALADLQRLAETTR